MTCKCTCNIRPHDIACYLRHCPHSLYDDQKIIEEGLERLYGEPKKGECCGRLPNGEGWGHTGACDPKRKDCKDCSNCPVPACIEHTHKPTAPEKPHNDLQCITLRDCEVEILRGGKELRKNERERVLDAVKEKIGKIEVS